MLGHPRGDRVLFEPGGLFLTETIRMVRAPLESVADGMSFGILVGLYLGLLPLGALLHALGTEEKLSVGALVTAAGRFSGSLSLLLGFALVVGALACAVPLAIRGLLETKIRSAFGDRGGDLVEFGFHMIALGVAWVIGVVHDLARAALVTRDLSALRAARAATEALRAFPAEALGGWALRALSALLLITIAVGTTNSASRRRRGWRRSPSCTSRLSSRSSFYGPTGLPSPCDWSDIATEGICRSDRSVVRVGPSRGRDA